MRIAYLDCFSGVSGDMFLGALLSAGLPLESLLAELEKLGLSEFRLEAGRTVRSGMEGFRVDVVTEETEPPHRKLDDIKAIIAGSGLDPEVKERSLAVFTRLAVAEAQVHGTTVNEVHFHEVGAVDAIVDIVGTVAGLALLGVEEVHASRITLGRGLAECRHGELPVPVPAAIELLKGAPVVFSGLEGELVTPTGAALVSTLARSIGSGYSFIPSRIGYGFGKREHKDGPPNALRLILGNQPEVSEQIVLLETNLDDATGQVVGFLIEKLLASGAMDAYASTIQMKKSRPGILFSALADEARADEIERLIFAETHTLGVRRQRVNRTRLERISASILTSLGEVNTKFARGPDGMTRAAPEYEDVARIARERNLPYRQILETIQRELPAWPRTADKLGPIEPSK
ncbi:MAG: nickel pincer cofactor biosynthesis protein LarC [Planctomycetota bacterium]